MPRQGSNLHAPVSETGDFSDSSTRQWFDDRLADHQIDPHQIGMAGVEPASPGLQPGATPTSATFPDLAWALGRGIRPRHSVKKEGRGLEPPAVTPPWFSRPVAVPSAVPSLISQQRIPKAEREGVEPSATPMSLLLSRKVLSATQPPLQKTRPHRNTDQRLG